MAKQRPDIHIVPVTSRTRSLLGVSVAAADCCSVALVVVAVVSDTVSSTLGTGEYMIDKKGRGLLIKEGPSICCKTEGKEGRVIGVMRAEEEEIRDTSPERRLTACFENEF